MVWLWAVVALAEGPAEDESEPSEETITLPSADLAPLPSALDLASGPSSSDVAAPEGVDPGPPAAPVWAARTSVRPRFQVMFADTGLDQLHPLTLGLEVARRTWLTGPTPSWAGELHFEGDLPLGQAAGSYDAALGLRGERRLGPIGLQLGPELIGSRTVWPYPRTVQLISVPGQPVWFSPLRPAIGVGLRAAVVVNLGPVGLYVGGQPVWWLAGDRRQASSMPVAGVGDEQRAEAGVGVTVGKVGLRARWSRAWTQAMPIDRVGLGLSFRLF
ncbi:MAG: hypothetical protein ACI9K2_006989 [Myxococcota bacterium]|jgi:hypothetical protein